MNHPILPREVRRGDRLRCRTRGDTLVRWANGDDRGVTLAEIWAEVTAVKLNRGYYTFTVRTPDGKHPVLGPYGGRTTLIVQRPDPPTPPGPLAGAEGMASLYLSVTLVGPDGRTYVAEYTDEIKITLRDTNPEESK